MSAQYLASEILSQILILLPESTVYQCMLVCKSWNTSATIRYFNTLRLGGERDYPLPVLAYNLKNGYLGFFKYGYLVKNLIIEGPFEEFKDPLDFFSLMMCLPYLKTIDISQCSQRSVILQGLRLFSKDFNLLNIEDIMICKATRETLPESNTSLEYYRTCYIFRETMTCLRLHDVENDYVMDNGDLKKIPDLLLPFKRLTSLYIDNHHCPVEKEKRIEYQLPLILKACPELTDVRICRPSFIPWTGPLTSLPKSSPGSKFDGVNLKKLSLTFSILEESLMQYILTSIDTSKLVLFTLKKIKYDTFNEITNKKPLFLKFIRHASLAQTFHFELESRHESGIPSLPSGSSNFHHVFWKMVQDLYRTRKLKSIFMDIHLLPDPQIHPLEYPKISCGVHIEDNKLRFHQRLPFMDFFEGRKCGEITTPLFNRYVADKTTSIEFCVDVGRFSEVLLFAATKLPNLKKLVLKDPESSPRRVIECYVNHKSNIDTGDLETRELFSSVSIEGMSINDPIFSEISRFIPKIESLRLRDCRLPTATGILKRGDFYRDKVYEFDLTKMKSLKRLILKLEFTYQFDQVTYLFKRFRESGLLIDKTYYMSHKVDGRHKFRVQNLKYNKELPKNPDGLVVIISFCLGVTNLYL
ncbi:hypothetical protein MFLAVUS_009255 [Mucor flavus]|uniref:F-box domain-containing protein n=1 Tax=Mucor flavus TaxID=439312 RepID=A0ABP9Z9D6_9FUNG